MSGAPAPPSGDGEPPADPFARWAHRRDPDLDLPPPEPEEGPGPARLAPGASRYGWFVGLLVLLILAYISLNTLRTTGLGGGVPVGSPLPPFAVPALASGLQKDANITPGRAPRKDGNTPACLVRTPGALNFCRLAAGRPTVLAFASVRDKDTVRELDAMQRVSTRFPSVLFFAVFLRGVRAEAARTAVQHSWTFPLGWDRHADVAAVYGVKSLPAVVLGDARGRSRGTAYAQLDPAAFAARVRGILRPLGAGSGPP